MGYAFGFQKIIFLRVCLNPIGDALLRKGSVPPCICLAASHYSSVRMSVGGSEEPSVCLPIGTSADQRCQGALDKEIGLCISKGHWKQMENRGATASLALSALKTCKVFFCLSQPLR